jgi:hypothetical protein
MSDRLRRNKHFILLLIHCRAEQSKALLYTLSKDQVRTLSEIAYNLHTLPTTPRIKAVLTKYKTLLGKLRNHTNWSSVKKVIENNPKRVLDILHAVESDLKKLLT